MFSPWLWPACPLPWRLPPPSPPPCLLCLALMAINVVLLPDLAGTGIVVAATQSLCIPTSLSSGCHHWLVDKCPLSILLWSFLVLYLFVLSRRKILVQRPLAGPCSHGRVIHNHLCAPVANVSGPQVALSGAPSTPMVLFILPNLGACELSGHPPCPCRCCDESCCEHWAMAVGGGGSSNCNGGRLRQGKWQRQGDRVMCGGWLLIVVMMRMMWVSGGCSVVWAFFVAACVRLTHLVSILTHLCLTSHICVKTHTFNLGIFTQDVWEHKMCEIKLLHKKPQSKNLLKKYALFLGGVNWQLSCNLLVEV